MSTFPKGMLEVQRGEVREGELAPREPGERERVCVCVCVHACGCGCGCGCARGRERECVCVWMRMWVCAIRDETIWGVAPREPGTDKQKGMAIEVDGE